METLATIFLSFKRWYGKYFYCLVVAAFGCFCYQICVFLLVFQPSANAYGLLTALNVGWTCMVSGQSLLLWSRLHLVCRNSVILNGIKWMIIVDGVVFHSLVYGFTIAVSTRFPHYPDIPANLPFRPSKTACLTTAIRNLQSQRRPRLRSLPSKNSSSQASTYTKPFRSSESAR